MSKYAEMAMRAPRPHGGRRTAARGLLLMLAIAMVAGCSSHVSAAAVPAAVRTTVNAPLTRSATVWNGWQQPSPTPKPNITLTDTAGQPFNLQVKTKGVVTLFYMGYTHCPDACPTTMAELAHVLTTLPPALANQIKVVFVTTDPARDTPSVLRAWLDQFNPNFVGLTGSMQQIDQLSRDVGMPLPQRQSGAGSADYGVVHASVVWAFDRQDNLAHLVYPEGTRSGAFAHDLMRLVQAGWQPSP